MEYTTLGQTGVEVSRICLGCLSFGDSHWRDWVLDEDESLEIIERAIDLGINFYDTANLYSKGESERVLGRALDGRRDEMVVASKCYYQMDEDDPNSGGLSRKAIEQELANSLDRLDMETIDLYQIHRWDYDTPIEQTLAALDDAVRRGHVRYIGASKMWAHQFAQSLYASDRLGLERFVTMQNHYNLVYREEEREMMPLCREEGIGCVPFSPLARGYLARPKEELEASKRAATDERIYRFPYRDGGGPEINARVAELSDDKGVSMAQLSVAWTLQKDPVDSVIVGVSSVDHLEDVVEAVTVDLSSSDVAYLEEPYEPVSVAGHE